MGQDIDQALGGWDFKPGLVQARVVRAGDGRQILQIRVELGVLQLELSGRPDGTRPFGFPHYLAYLTDLARKREQAELLFTLDEDQCTEADREFFQFYQRRLAFFALKSFELALRDADHTLQLMDFVKTHGPNEEYKRAHEQYRPYVLFHRTLARVEIAMSRNRAEEAIDQINEGMAAMRRIYEEYEVDQEDLAEDMMLRELKKKQSELRRLSKVEKTLQEQLGEAIAEEDYERAARLRDQLKQR